MVVLGRIAIEQGQYAVAEAWVEQALAAYRSSRRSLRRCQRRTHLAEIALGCDDDHAAKQWAEASLALTVGLSWTFMVALTQLTLMELCRAEVASTRPGGMCCKAWRRAHPIMLSVQSPSPLPWWLRCSVICPALCRNEAGRLPGCGGP